eukprot:TRINITY_DN14791_c0_g2_i5.p1 TRINITY_DN14791_c0_g2~~TRINITY_DN14791_c0_g2_i5.p1  ORF type:complete len:165 (+),score=13.37 TRINITY_DN14791_c0_g2_i5:523-1017(+)
MCTYTVVYLAIIGITIGDLVFPYTDCLKAANNYTTIPCDILQKALFNLDAMLYILVVIGFMVYAAILCYRFRHGLLLEKTKKAVEYIKKLTALVTLTYTIRAALTLEEIWAQHSFMVQAQNHYWFDPLYYIFLDLLPSVIMLSIFLHNPEVQSNSDSSSCVYSA